MTIAIDFDGTIKRSSQFDPVEATMWLAVIHTFVSNGNNVIIATMRTPDQGLLDMEPYLRLFKHCLRMNIDVVFCSGLGLKRDACLSQGHKVDIWIDDMPGMIERLPILPDKPLGHSLDEVAE